MSDDFWVSVDGLHDSGGGFDAKSRQLDALHAHIRELISQGSDAVGNDSAGRAVHQQLASYGEDLAQGVQNWSKAVGKTGTSVRRAAGVFGDTDEENRGLVNRDLSPLVGGSAHDSSPGRVAGEQPQPRLHRDAIESEPVSSPDSLRVAGEQPQPRLHRDAIESEPVSSPDSLPAPAASLLQRPLDPGVQPVSSPDSLPAPAASLLQHPLDPGVQPVSSPDSVAVLDDQPQGPRLDDEEAVSQPESEPGAATRKK